MCSYGSGRCSGWPEVELAKQAKEMEKQARASSAGAAVDDSENARVTVLVLRNAVAVHGLRSAGQLRVVGAHQSVGVVLLGLREEASLA